MDYKSKNEILNLAKEATIIGLITPQPPQTNKNKVNVKEFAYMKDKK